ncbi:MBL fold metallo-hydrolase [Chloroflexota bacterium]
MRIRYLGHSCFLITSDNGVSIITDPYHTEDDLAYGEITEAADIVTVSHDHYDHNNVAAVRGNPQVVRATTRVKGIEFTGTPSYHDDADGRRRGGNTIFCFEVDGIRLCHLGDLGHCLSVVQVAELGKVDVLFIPVGGYFTIDAATATGVCNQLQPGLIIPMHWNDKWDVPHVAGVDDFMKGKVDVSRPDASEIELKSGKLPAGRITVLKSAL